MQQERPSSPDQVVWPVQRNHATKQEDRPLETPVILPATVLLRHGARMLDPTQAVQPGTRRRARDLDRDPSQPLPAVRYQPTAYVADELIVSVPAVDPGDLVDDRGELALAKLEDVRLVANRRDLSLAERRHRTGSPSPVRFTIVPSSPRPRGPVDAWEVVQRLREEVDRSVQIGLNHLMFAADIGGVGFSMGHGIDGVGFSMGHAVGPAEYAMPGSGGRAPVRWLGRPPTRSPLKRRPVVAILDTGVGHHPWFDRDDDPVVTRFRYQPLAGTVVPDDAGGADEDPNLLDPLAGLVDPFFGHGTFIAGLVHQTCPDADIVSFKMMGPDGIVVEAALLHGLADLHQRQVTALDRGEDGLAGLVDIVSLSLGYYHETDADDDYDHLVRDAVRALAEVGILVVAAAGNDATSRKLLPAGFSPISDGVLGEVGVTLPLISVAALNPDGGVALFSNDGDWVACHCPGAALVSTLPLADAGQSPGVDLSTGSTVDRAVGSWRASIDPDRFTGFGTWSGTSFAAPVLAGATAQAMLDTDESETLVAVGRTRAALTALGFTLSAP
jgi:hypothetical protein